MGMLHQPEGVICGGLFWGLIDSDPCWPAVSAGRIDEDGDAVTLVEWFNNHNNRKIYAEVDAEIGDDQSSDWNTAYRHALLAEKEPRRIMRPYESPFVWCGIRVVLATDTRDAVAFARVPERYEGAVDYARTRFAAFRAFCAERGVVVDEGRLLFVRDWE